MTATLHELRQNLTLTREVYGRGSSHAQAAFEQLVRSAAAGGIPLDALRQRSEDEVERFFSFTIPGPDGHVYWDGPRAFYRNDGKARAPRRWWWSQANGADLENWDDIIVKCGDGGCINPEHCAKERTRGMQVYWTPERIIGKLQVIAMRLGHTPTGSEWDRLRTAPTSGWITGRLGSWDKAVEAAGLAPVERIVVEHDKENVLKGILLVRDLFGRWPSEKNYRTYRKELLAARLPATTRASVRLFGSFPAARIAAGGPASVLSDAQRGRDGRPSEHAATRDDCIAAIRFVYDRLGRWPTLRELTACSARLAEENLPSSGTPFRRLFGSFAPARAAAGGPAHLPWGSSRGETREDE